MKAKNDKRDSDVKEQQDLLSNLDFNVLALAGYLAGYVNMIRNTEPKTTPSR